MNAPLFDRTRGRLLPPADILFGTSPAAREVCSRLQTIAHADLPVVLLGEAGTGKELAARWIHSISEFADGHFVKATCVALQGEEQCRVTVDDEPWTGRGPLLEPLRTVRSGTLFLDDVENLALVTQALLARVVDEGLHLSPTDAVTSTALRFRIISATRNELRASLTGEGLRPEFFHSINAFTARMLPLRERIEELPLLTEYFIGVYAGELGIARPLLSPGALEALSGYRWPGNTRELEEMIISYVLTGSETLLTEKVRALSRTPQIDAAMAAGEGALPVAETGRRAGRGAHHIGDEEILRILRENRWNRRQAALRLQMSYRTLLNRLKLMDMQGHRTPTVPNTRIG